MSLIEERMPGTDMSDSILVEQPAPHVALVRFNRPERMNALSVAMVTRLKQVVDDLAASRTRVVLFRGAGRGFCAGADLKERQSMDLDARLAHNAAINAAINAIAALPMPTIAVINGVALGGGCELALACDMRFAAADAQIGLTESRLGALPGAGGTQRLPRLVGTAHALEMMLSGEPLSASRAEKIGLLNEAVAADQLDGRVLTLAATMASRAPAALREIKTLVHTGVEMPLADALRRERASLAEIFNSADYAEGLAAFMEKRPPRFQ